MPVWPSWASALRPARIARYALSRARFRLRCSKRRSTVRTACSCSSREGSDLTLQEVFASSQLVREAAHPEANIIFGNVIDDALGDEIRVTVIAAGFDDATDAQLSRPHRCRVAAPVAQQRPAAPEAKAPAAETTRISQVSTRRPLHRADVAAPVREAAPAPVEAPAAVEYEESESEHSFEVPRVYPRPPRRKSWIFPPSFADD